MCYNNIVNKIREVDIMRGIENEEILSEKVNKYYESEEFYKDTEKWVDRTYDFFFDFCALNLNTSWLVAKLCEGHIVDIYATIISGYERLLNSNIYKKKENIEYINKRLSENRQTFFRTLSRLIADYCVV